MRIAPKDITVDALERNVIRKALDALIAKEQARIKRIRANTNPASMNQALDTIAEATDLLELFKN